MSGHNKWSKIKRVKEIKDKIKGNTFSKLSRLITLAVIEGNGISDPESNFKLRMAIEKARNFNMPKENIQKAINNALGPDKSQLKEVIYEGFAPGGVGLLIESTTDNPNRTLGEIRVVLDRHQGKLASQGAVGYLFKRYGQIVFEKDQINEEKLYLFADQIGALDIDEVGEKYLVLVPYENMGKIKEFLVDTKPNNIEIIYKPQTLISITDNETEQKIIQLIEALESLDDVQRVFTNYEKG